MTKQEFQEMTGLTVDEEQMWGIHEAYLTTNAQIADLQKIIAQQQKTISELSATIAKLVK